MKKTVAVFLCAIMLVSALAGLTACGPTQTDTTNLRDYGYDPAITLTLSNLSYVQYVPLLNAMGWTLTDNDIMNLIRDELGMKFTLDIDVTDIGVYFEKLSANIAAGQLSDIACMGDFYFGIPNLKAAEQNGLLADLTPYVNGTDANTVASDDVKELWEQSGEEIFYPGTFDGKIKTLPWVTDARGSAYSFLYFRQDWLDAVGKAVPTSVDELTEVMRAFKNMSDDGTTYGMVVGQGFMTQGENYCSVFDMYGAHPLMWIEDGDNLALGITDTEPMKAALSTLRQWYADGLINHTVGDNDIFELGGLHYMSQEFASGKAGVFCGGSTMGFVSSTIKKNPDAEITAVPLFAADGYDLELSCANNAYMFYAAGVSGAHPEAAMKLYNWYIDIGQDEEYTKYFEPTTYENDKGETVEDYARVQFAPIRTNGKTDIDKSRTFLEDVQTKNTEGMTEGQLKTYNNYWDAVAETTNKNYWLVKQYEEGGILEKAYDILENGNFVRTKFFTVNTEAMDQYNEVIESNVVIGALDIIVGTQPVDYWDTVVQAWLDGGGSEITAEVNAWWDSIKGE